MLIKPAARQVVQKMADREKCPVNFVGEITGNGKVSARLQARIQPPDRALHAATHCGMRLSLAE